MNMQSFTVCALAGLTLALLPAFVYADLPPAAPPPVSATADTPAVVAVRLFLSARSAKQYDAAYALLSASAQEQTSKGDFVAGLPIPLSEASQFPAPAFGLIALLTDTHNTLGYTFTVMGADPANPCAVLVHAEPPAGSKDLSAATLHLLTVDDSATHVPRLDVLESLHRTAPQQFERVKANDERTTSLSNLKRIALGIIQYTQDHDEVMPDAGKWVDEIMPYVRSEAVFHDPSAPAIQKWSYAYNRALSRKSLYQFDAPASTVMLFESTAGVKNASDTGQSVPVPGRHSGGTDDALADGHVKYFRDGSALSYRLDGK